MTTRRFRAALADGVSALTLAARQRSRPGPMDRLRSDELSQNVLTAARELQQVNNSD